MESELGDKIGRFFAADRNALSLKTDANLLGRHQALFCIRCESSAVRPHNRGKRRVVPFKAKVFDERSTFFS